MMMNAAMRRFRADVPAFIVGALVCLLGAMWISPGGEADWLWEIYDEWHPVATGRVDNVVKDGEAVEFDLFTTKDRQCKFVQSSAYALSQKSREYMLLQRLDRPMTGVTHPTGIEIKVGRWKAWPTAGAERMEFWIAYRCASRDVLTKIVEVPL
jgi:hypothetical protein